MALNLRLGWDLVQRADQAKAEKMLSDEKPQLLIFESYVPVSLSLSTATRKARRVGRPAGAGQTCHLEFACSLARLHIEQG